MSTIWIDPVELRGAADTLGSAGGQIQELMTGTRTACTCEVPRALDAWLDSELVEITQTALLVSLLYTLSAIDCAARADGIAADQSLVSAQPGLYPTEVTIGGFTGLGFTSYGTTMENATVGGYTGLGFGSYGVAGGAGMGIIGGFGSGFTSYGTPTSGAPLVGGFGSGFSALGDNDRGVSMTIGGGRSFGSSGPGAYLDAWGNVRNVNMPATEAALANPATRGIAEAVVRGSSERIIDRAVAPTGLTPVSGGDFVDERGRRGPLSATYRNPETGRLEF